MKHSSIIYYLLALLGAVSCVEYDAEPFTGKIMPRATGYSSGVTDDWIYFNLHTGEVFNKYMPNEDIREGEQFNRTDWDLAFCGYHMRTNSGTSGCGQGGAIDLGYGDYDRWKTVAQLPTNAEWITDTDTDVYITYSQSDWYRHLLENHMNVEDNPWFDPNSGPARKLTSANRKLEESMSLAGPPMSYTPSYHTYVVRTADGLRYFKLQVVNWYNVHSEIDATGGELSYYCDELNGI
ncbi:MAG: HmuY family protein [Dysgonamonadaceae bacterium]|jgi:hypothetical protein|nr:HmuY family protein [Dysgonamonadaceae bacterium]